jgi:hypothetical protein
MREKMSYKDIFRLQAVHNFGTANIVGADVMGKQWQIVRNHLL